MPTKAISWQTHEYAEKHHSPEWYWAVGIIGLGAVITSFILGNPLLGILLLLGLFSILVHAAKGPDFIQITIDTKGVRAKHDYFPYSTLDSFWVEEELQPTLIILSKERLLQPHIRLPLTDEVDVDELRLLLASFLEETYHPPSFIESMADYFGF